MSPEPFSSATELGFHGSKGAPMRTPDPLSLRSSPGTRVQGWGMNTCPPAAGPDSHLGAQTGHFPAWGQPEGQYLSSLLQRLINQPSGAALWLPWKLRGVLWPLGEKPNRMCLWLVANSPTSFLLTEKYLLLSFGHEAWKQSLLSQTSWSTKSH